VTALTGSQMALDGWSIRWDIRPDQDAQSIRYYNERHICQRITSGQIDEHDLERALSQFHREHTGQERLL